MKNFTLFTDARFSIVGDRTDNKPGAAGAWGNQ
jgi:hypothetical protein